MRGAKTSSSLAIRLPAESRKTRSSIFLTHSPCSPASALTFLFQEDSIMKNTTVKKPLPSNMEEKILLEKSNGIAVLLGVIILYLAAIFALIAEISSMVTILSILWLSLGWILLFGLKAVKPQEAIVLTLFGTYTGTIKTPGLFFVNPFSTVYNPAADTKLGQSEDVNKSSGLGSIFISGNQSYRLPLNKKISLKIMTLSNSRQKINDALGNPVEIAVAVTWRVYDTAKAVFAVDNYKEFLSLQCDSSVRNIVRLYPYDVAPNIDTTGDGLADEGSLRGSSETVARRIKEEIQGHVKEAGIEIIDARITYLAYAPEIASVMLKRQQASAIIDARAMIVDGAVSMVQMALAQLERDQIVELDEERKAQMVANLLVILCGDRDAQPVVNAGTLY